MNNINSVDMVEIPTINKRATVSGTVSDSKPNSDKSLDFSVSVEKFSNVELLRLANNVTMRFERGSKQGLLGAYMSQHSTVRTQHFSILFKNIPKFVAAHYSRHWVGSQPYSGSQRHDLGGDPNAGRWTPTYLLLDMNAQSLIDICRARLCLKCSEESTFIVDAMIKAIVEVDPKLARCLVPNCVYRNGFCPEGGRTCGKVKLQMKKYSGYVERINN